MHLPPTFRVSNEDIPPLVTMTDVEAHLILLSAFAKLKQDVQNACASPATSHLHHQDAAPSCPTDPNRAWVVFVNRAVHRFDRFMSGSWSEDVPVWSETVIPPLDVIMVWHTYLLNPRIYHEDSLRRLTNFARRLAAMGSMPLTLVASTIHPTTFEPNLPSPEREAFFESTSGLAFMYTLATSFDEVLSLDCPCCNTTNNYVRWVTREGESGGGGIGFAEPLFRHKCDWCERSFTRSIMGVRRFCDEVTERRAGSKVFFAETLLQPRSGRVDEARGVALTKRILSGIYARYALEPDCKEENVIQEAVDLSTTLKWEASNLSDLIHQGLRPRKTQYQESEPLPRVQRIIAAYSTPGHASLDLVTAVLRQEGFVTKLKEVGWLCSMDGAIEGRTPALLRAIARYHAFLDLMSSKSQSLLVPTLDIDLVWHTHQLAATAYRSDTLRLLLRVPNHDDNVESTTLQAAYDTTAAAWRVRYGVPYSVCGCMPDPPTTGKVKADKGKDKASRSIKTFVPCSLMMAATIVSVRRSSTSALHAPATSSRDGGSLVSLDISEADTSHPSEHNFYVSTAPVSTRLDRDLVTRDVEARTRSALIKKIPSDFWRRIQSERKERRSDHREAFTTRQGVDGPYYAYWGVSANVPHGFYGATKYKDAIGGCASGCATCGAPGL